MKSNINFVTFETCTFLVNIPIGQLCYHENVAYLHENHQETRQCFFLGKKINCLQYQCAMLGQVLNL